MYAEQTRDLMEEYIKFVFEKDAAKKTELENKFWSQIFPDNLNLFEKRIVANGSSGYLVGDSLTWVDLFFNDLVNWFDEAKRVAAFASVPHVQKHDTLIRGLPRVAEWIAARPVDPK
jgi:hypothetical protein